MAKTKSVWVYFHPMFSEVLEPRLRQTAEQMGGTEEGSGCSFGSRPEKDLSFSFADPKAAAKFADLIRKWKHVRRTEIVGQEE